MTPLDVVESTHVHLVSFTFGCPTSEIVERLHRADIQVAVTAFRHRRSLLQLAVDAGADLLSQWHCAGGYRGSFADLRRGVNHRPLLSVLEEIRETTDVPMIGTGGVMTGRDAAAVLGAGAIAVQLGTALLLYAGGGDVCPIPAGAAGCALPRHDPHPRLQRTLCPWAGKPVRARARRAGPAGIPGGAPPHPPASRRRHPGRRRQRAQPLGRHRLASADRRAGRHDRPPHRRRCPTR